MIWLSLIFMESKFVATFFFILAVYFFVRALEDKKNILLYLFRFIFFILSAISLCRFLASGNSCSRVFSILSLFTKKHQTTSFECHQHGCCATCRQCPINYIWCAKWFYKSKSFIKLLTGNEVVSNSNGLSEIVHTFSAFNNHAFHISAPFMLNTFIFFLLISCILFLYKEKEF